MRRAAAFALAIASLLVLPSWAGAHGLHAGHADLLLAEDGTLFVTLQIPSGDAAGFFAGAEPTATLQDAPEPVATYLSSRFAAVADKTACSQQLTWQWQAEGQLPETVWTFQARFACSPSPAELTVLDRLLFEREHSYRHSLILRAPSITSTARTTPDQPSALFPLPASARQEGWLDQLTPVAWAGWSLALVAIIACVALSLVLRKRSGSHKRLT